MAQEINLGRYAKAQVTSVSFSADPLDKLSLELYVVDGERKVFIDKTLKDLLRELGEPEQEREIFSARFENCVVSIKPGNIPGSYGCCAVGVRAVLKRITKEMYYDSRRAMRIPMYVANILGGRRYQRAAISKTFLPAQ